MMKPSLLQKTLTVLNKTPARRRAEQNPAATKIASRAEQKQRPRETTKRAEQNPPNRRTPARAEQKPPNRRTPARAEQKPRECRIAQCAEQKLWLRIAVTCAFFLLSHAGLAQQNPPPQYGEGPQNREAAAKQFAANKAKHGADQNFLVLPGLVADQKNKRIKLLAEATGLPKGSILEFLLIDQRSGKGYESLLWSLAKPSDVHRALEFIGMKPGKPFDPNALRFWSKGERVLVTIAPKKPGEKPRPLTSLVLDKNTNKPVPAAGFVFAGSFRTKDRDGKSQYAADVYDPKSVATLYNDPIAVLDVPRRAIKQEVYGSLVVGPNYDFAPNELVTLVLEPEHKDGRKRVLDLVLRFARSAELGKIECVLTKTDGTSMCDKRDLPSVLAAFGDLAKRGRDPFVSVHFDAALPLADVAKISRVLSAVDTETGIRIEPPARGQLFYRAMLPTKELLDRENRIVDPWELRLSAGKDGLAGKLTLNEAFWSDGQTRRVESNFEVATPAALRRQLDAVAKERKAAERRPPPPVLLVIADERITYGALVDFLGPAMTTHDVVHLFLKNQATQ